MTVTTDDFPEFSLERLLDTVFKPQKGEQVAVLIDLEDPKEIKDMAFLDQQKYSVQQNAIKYFHKPLNDEVLDKMGLKGGELFAYKRTGGSNLDLPDEAYSPAGTKLSLEQNIYPNYDIILCISSDSATAPLTAFSKQYGFRGATLHGLNDIIAQSGLAVDYNEISKEAEKIRVGFTKADAVEIDFEVEGKKHTLRLELGSQEAQKSHGLCHTSPDVANLPAGEVYFVPNGVSGTFPLKFEDGTIGLMECEGEAIKKATLLKGDAKVIEEFSALIEADPAAGLIGELGFGTQVLPVSGQDIQDEKIRGTVHVATGRSDHLGGDITPDKFNEAGNAKHEDILFSPEKTPEINVPQVRMYWKGEGDGNSQVLIENFKPSKYIEGLLAQK